MPCDVSQSYDTLSGLPISYMSDPRLLSGGMHQEEVGAARGTPR